MVLRSSVLGLHGEPYASTDNTTNYIVYKCPKCDAIQRFDVQDEKEYLGQVRAHRGGMLFVPDMEDWERDEEIKKQLSALGYF